MTRFYSLILSIVLLTVLVAAYDTVAEEGSEKLSVRVEDGLLSVKATKVPHSQILEALAEQLGFKLYISGPLDKRLSLEIHSKPRIEGLKKALYPASWAFVYQSFGGSYRLTKVFVLSPEEADGSPFTKAAFTTAKEQGSFKDQEPVKHVLLSAQKSRRSVAEMADLLDRQAFMPVWQNGQVEGYRVGEIPSHWVLFKVGLREQDIVLMINGERVPSPTGLLKAFQLVEAGALTTFTVDRRGEIKLLEVEGIGTR